VEAVDKFKPLRDWVKKRVAIGEIGINLDTGVFYIVGAEDVEHTAYYRSFIENWLAGYGITEYCENRKFIIGQNKWRFIRG
jgi:hypothetical protein